MAFDGASDSEIEAHVAAASPVLLRPRHRPAIPTPSIPFGQPDPSRTSSLARPLYEFG